MEGYHKADTCPSWFTMSIPSHWVTSRVYGSCLSSFLETDDSVQVLFAPEIRTRDNTEGVRGIFPSFPIFILFFLRVRGRIQNKYPTPHLLSFVSLFSSARQPFLQCNIIRNAHQCVRSSSAWGWPGPFYGGDSAWHLSNETNKNHQERKQAAP